MIINETEFLKPFITQKVGFVEKDGKPNLKLSKKFEIKYKKGLHSVHCGTKYYDQCVNCSFACDLFNLGVDQFCQDIEDMIRPCPSWCNKLLLYFKACWVFCTPFLLLVSTVFGVE